MSVYEFNVTLYRDSLSTPWGFRLEGGRDFHSPLAIQRVFTGSPASVDLQRGDLITSIQHRETSFMQHHEANDLIRSCGGSLHLGIRRDSRNALSNASYSTFKPAFSLLQPGGKSLKMSYNQYTSFGNLGHSYLDDDPLAMYVRSRPIEKTRDPKPILSQTGSPMLPGDSFSSRGSLKRYRPASTMPLLPKTSFTSPTQPSYPNYMNTNSTPLPFQDKRMVNQIQQSLSNAVFSPPVAHNFSHQHYSAFNPPVRAPQQHQFKSVNQIQNKVFSHHEASDMTPKSPRIGNLQYNSPIGLYSQANVREEYQRQMGPQEFQIAQSSEF